MWHICICMKKNTLLYLDNNLVDKAKEANINISQFVEKKLKEELRAARPKTASEYLQKIVSDTNLDGNSFYGEAYQLPFQIESLKLENVGLFKSFELTFKKDTVNLISGPNGSGKSTILRSILLAFGKRHKYFPKSPTGQIILTPFPNQCQITISVAEEAQDNYMNGYKCLIGDGIFNLIPAEMLTVVFQELHKLRIQAIITTLNEFDSINYPKNTNLIKLENQCLL